MPLVVQNKDNIFTSSVIRSQKILICHHNLTRSLRSLFRLFGDISIFLLTHSFSRENIIFIFHHSWHIVTLFDNSQKCLRSIDLNMIFSRVEMSFLTSEASFEWHLNLSIVKFALDFAKNKKSPCNYTFSLYVSILSN